VSVDIIAMPARVWDKEEAPTAPPEVLVSSRDGAPVPPVAGAVRLAALAEKHGWATLTTYALAAVPERLYLNGNVAKAAHRLASVAVRLAHGVVRGYAMWHNEDEHGWRFASAWLGTTQYGWRAFQEVVSGRPALNLAGGGFSAGRPDTTSDLAPIPTSMGGAA